MKVKLVDKYSKLPTRKHPTDAGLDLYARMNYTIPPNGTKIVKTGVCIELPENSFGLVKPKSRNDFLVGAGVVDSNYRGEVGVKIVNTTKDMLVIAIGDAVAQLVVIPVLFPDIEVVEILDETDRGESGGLWKTD